MKDGCMIMRCRENCKTENSPVGLIFSYGDMLIDIYKIMSCGLPVEVPGFLEAPGGSPATVAIAVARLGGKSAFVGKLGDEEFRRRLAGILENNGVVGEGKYFNNLNFDLARSAKVFHYGSINLIGEPCKTEQLNAMAEAKAAGLLLSYDPQLALWPLPQTKAIEQIKSIWDEADLIKVSDVELKLLAESNKIDKSAKLLMHPTLKLLLVTFGDLSCKYYTKNFHGKVEAFRVDTVDTTGAGDSFVGALLCKIVDDQSILNDEPRLRDVLKFANACGAITTTKKGVIPALPTESDALTLIGGA